MQPTVVINHHRQTAIIIANQGDKLQLIRLAKGRLTVSSLTAVEIRALGYRVCDYSPSEAARAYLKHGAGVSRHARMHLERITQNQLPGTLSLT
jgi:hypothetical protein